MSHILLIGGHGKVALRLTPLLVAAGHQVSSVIRNPEHRSAVETAGAEAVIADVEKLSTTELSDVVGGHQALVWLAGAGGGDPERTKAVDHLAAVRSMDAAVASGLQRYVMLSYLGAGLDHGVPPSSSFFAYAEAKAAADDHLRRSAMDWTILGPGALTLDPGTGRIEIADHPAASSVSRDDVAAVAAAVLDNPATVGHTLNFNAGPTPIVEAIEEFIA
ncbi:MAG: SDR family oxidoreductase [Aquihabitans sp.]